MTRPSSSRCAGACASSRRSSRWRAPRARRSSSTRRSRRSSSRRPARCTRRSARSRSRARAARAARSHSAAARTARATRSSAALAALAPHGEDGRLAIPLPTRRGAHGALVAWRSRPGAFSAREQELAEAAAAHAATVLAGARGAMRGLFAREVHHRVKNNLQTVASLLRLAASGDVDPEARPARLDRPRARDRGGARPAHGARATRTSTAPTSCAGCAACCAARSTARSRPDRWRRSCSRPSARRRSRSCSASSRRTRSSTAAGTPTSS